MRKFLLAAAFAALAAPALAQGPVPGGPMTDDNVARIMTYLRASPPPVAANMPQNVTMIDGISIPDHVELRSFPPNMNMANLRYVRVGNSVAVVDAATRRIVRVLSM